MSQPRYRDLAEDGHGLICMHDLDGRLEWVSPAIARLLGYEPADMVGRISPFTVRSSSSAASHPRSF